LNQVGRIAGGTIAIGTGVLAMKAAAWWLTGSAALYSDALESVVNVVASVVAFVALRLAARPADANHPYGHDKVEFFAAVIEGVLIIVAAGSILEHAWETWNRSGPLQQPWLGMGLNAFSTVINAGWAGVLRRAGKRHRSPALAADGRHLWTDVVTSVGITAGLVLVVETGLQWLDPALAVGVAMNVLWSGVRVVTDSVGGLMDAAPAGVIVERIRLLVGQHADGAIEAHDLRTRHAGRLTYLEFHLVVPGDMRVAEAHAICDRIEAALKAEVEGLVITIHVEPELKAKHSGVLVL